MTRQIIAPPFIHKTTGYSHAVEAGDTLYIAGQVGLDPAGNLVGAGDAEAQAEQCYRNIETIVRHFGGTLDHVVRRRGVQVRHERDTASIMLVGRVVQALLGTVGSSSDHWQRSPASRARRYGMSRLPACGPVGRAGVP